MKKMFWVFFVMLASITDQARGQICSYEDSLIYAEILRQQEWYLELIYSPMYKEILIRESTLKSMYTEWHRTEPRNPRRNFKKLCERVPPLPEHIIDSIIKTRYEAVKKGGYRLIDDSREHMGGPLSGFSDTTNYVGIYLTLRPFVTNPFTGEKIDFPCVGDLPLKGQVGIKRLFLKYYPTTPIHEFSHQSTDLNNEMFKSSLNIIAQGIKPDSISKNYYRDIKAGVLYKYYDNPSEVKARLDELKYCLWRDSLIDLRYQRFTQEDYRRIFKEKYYFLKSTDTGVRDLYRKILWKKKHIIWLFNNIA